MNPAPYTREYFVEQGRKGGLANSAKQRASRAKNPGRPKGSRNKIKTVTGSEQ